jgi:DNA-binding response OmpR family regulator
MADLNPKKVVVIDGDSDSIEPLERSLRERGYQPVVLRRGRRAVELVKSEKPGAVVLELALPDVDGCGVIKQLQDDWEAKKVPIVVFSNYPNRLSGAQREKVEAVVGKPADWEDLLGQVQKAIAKGQSN